MPTGAIPYREYLCGRCNTKFRVPRCQKCGGPAVKILREKAVEVVASPEMLIQGAGVKKELPCRLVFFGLRTNPKGLRERIQETVNQWLIDECPEEEPIP